jgi:dephospho-CoA kinase
MNCDTTILVCAPKAQRIQRIINRDHITKEAIEARMKHQWSDNKKKLLSDYVIQNEYLEVGINEAKRIMKILIKNS